MPGQLSSRRAPTLPLAPLLRLLPGLAILLLLLLLAVLLLLLPIPILLQLLHVWRRRPLRLLLPCPDPGSEMRRGGGGLAALADC